MNMCVLHLNFHVYKGYFCILIQNKILHITGKFVVFVLDQFLFDFGSDLGAFWEPKSSKNVV